MSLLARQTPFMRRFASISKERKAKLELKMQVWGGRMLLVNEMLTLSVLLGGGGWLLSYAINWDSVRESKERILAKINGTATA